AADAADLQQPASRVAVCSAESSSLQATTGDLSRLARPRAACSKALPVPWSIQWRCTSRYENRLMGQGPSGFRMLSRCRCEGCSACERSAKGWRPNNATRPIALYESRLDKKYSLAQRDAPRGTVGDNR